jgi:hypothetical protein
MAAELCMSLDIPGAMKYKGLLRLLFSTSLFLTRMRFMLSLAAGLFAASCRAAPSQNIERQSTNRYVFAHYMVRIQLSDIAAIHAYRWAS